MEQTSSMLARPEAASSRCSAFSEHPRNNAGVPDKGSNHCKRYARLFPLALVTMLWALAAIPAAWAGSSTDQLRQRIDRLIAVITEPRLKGPAQADERHRAMISLARESMDEKEISRLALGRHWTERTPEEKRQFTALFTDLLVESYVKRVDAYVQEKDDFSPDSVRYLDENQRGRHAVVSTKIMGEGGDELSISYLMTEIEDRWRIVDIAIEGVSIVRNYNAQFDEILSHESFQHLLDLIREKKSEG